MYISTVATPNWTGLNVSRSISHTLRMKAPWYSVTGSAILWATPRLAFRLTTLFGCRALQTAMAVNSILRISRPIVLTVQSPRKYRLRNIDWQQGSSTSINPKSIRILSGCGNRCSEVIKTPAAWTSDFSCSASKNLQNSFAKQKIPLAYPQFSPLIALRALEPASARFVCKLSFHPLAYSQL